MEDVDGNDRVALFFKGYDMNVSFNYFNVTSVSTAPEPGTLALISLGAFGGWFARKKSQRSA